MVKRIRQQPCECFIDDQWLMACPLHAAAPALLEALTNACDSVAPDRFGDGRPTWYDAARAAIRAARGEKNNG